MVGGSLAGMAVAGRLARLGHDVTLFEATGDLGGLRQRIGLGPVIDFPAPWRDLWFKTGRTLDAVLAARGLEMVPAPATHHIFPDGSTLDLPTERGAQFHAIAETFGAPAAEAWRDLVDDLDPVWQIVRTHGMEREAAPTVWRQLRRELLDGRTIADLAARLPAPLPHLVTQVAWQAGLHPAQAPAHLAAHLTRDRTFGHWVITDTAGRPQDLRVLIALLTDRLAERGVEVLTDTPVTRIHGTTVHTTTTTHVDAVVLSLSAAEICRIVDHSWRLRTVRRATQLPAAAAPDLSEPTGPTAPPTVDHAARHLAWPTGRWSWDRPTHDPAFGHGWRGLASWEKLLTPRLRAGLYAVGSTTAAGADPAGLLLSAALAADLCHEELTGEDVRPTNRTPPPRRPQAKPSRLSGLTSARKATDPA